MTGVEACSNTLLLLYLLRKIIVFNTLMSACFADVHVGVFVYVGKLS